MRGSVKAIIVAAGEGKRFGGSRPKQFLPIAGKTVLEHSIIPFQKSTGIGEIIVVLPESYLKPYSKKLKKAYAKISRIVAGGRERTDSVRNGIRAAGHASVYIIHDGARPLVSRELIRRVIRGAIKFGAAVPAVGMHDTVKEADPSGFVKRTVDRNTLCCVQTPQGFRKKVLEDSIMRQSRRKNIRVTDEATLAELAGFRVKIVEGDFCNVKITTADDLKIARALIEGGRTAR